MPYPDSTFREKVKAVGQTRDWRYSNAPVLDTVYSFTQRAKGGMPINLRHPRSPDGKFRSGGPWVQFSSETELINSPQITWYRVNYYPAFTGRRGLSTMLSSAKFHTIFPKTWEEYYNDAEQDGAEAWAALRPDLPDFSAVSSMMELKDLGNTLKEGVRLFLAKMRREKIRLRSRGAPHREYSDKHLELMLGWLPLMGDVKNFCSAYHRREKRLRQVIRDERRWVRREAYLGENDLSPSPTSVTSTGRNHPMLTPVLVTQCYAGNNQYITTNKTKAVRRRWASGKFKYLLPPGPRDGRWRNRIRRRIMGGYISASQAYNLIPWSFVADYFSDLGDFFDAAQEGIGEKLICQYAYIMHRYTVDEEESYSDALIIGSNTTSAWNTVKVRYKTELKIRVAASPFGWGLSDDDLTPRQIGILGALGASKL
nr:MAG: hypothetical protein 1 [Leviviridae sp.]